MTTYLRNLYTDDLQELNNEENLRFAKILQEYLDEEIIKLQMQYFYYRMVNIIIHSLKTFQGCLDLK